LSASLGVTQSRGAATGGNFAPELQSLTSLRGIAAVTVVLYHSSFLAFNYAGGAPPWLWRRGSLAVDLFFFLSGFILTHVYGRRLDQDRSWRTIGRFLWARFSRIYPASLFTTVVFVLAFTVGNLLFPTGDSFIKQLIAALLLMQVPSLDKVIINSPSWSISAEWYAYLLFLFVISMIYRLRALTAAVVCVALLIEIAVFHTIFSYKQPAEGWGALVRASPEFAVGLFAYRYYRERLLRKIWGNDIVLIAIVITIAAGCLLGAPDSLTVILSSSTVHGGSVSRWNARPARDQWPPIRANRDFVCIRRRRAGARCIDVPARAMLRRLPDWMMTFASGERVAKLNLMSLMSAGLPERDR
jgi:peptidoglycan/LPS O-acetylase OafA/YrhL